MKDIQMELMDWKNLEAGAEERTRLSMVEATIAKILYEVAVKNIRKLGGKTNEEENAEHNAKQPSKAA